jgi:hypothetical protein
MTNPTGLRLSVFRNPLGDCTNGGITSRVRQVTLVGFRDETGLHNHGQVNGEVHYIPGPFEATEDAPAVILVHRYVGGGILHIEPLAPVPAGHIGYMSGGNYAAASDSRVSEMAARLVRHAWYGAFDVHDRSETPEQYRALSG